MIETVAWETYTLIVIADNRVEFVDVDEDKEIIYCSPDMEKSVTVLLRHGEGLLKLKQFLDLLRPIGPLDRTR